MSCLRQGFDLASLDFSGFVSHSFFSLLSGNAMSLPVVAAFQTAMLHTINFNKGVFRGRRTSLIRTVVVPTPGFQEDDEDADQESDHSSNESFTAPSEEVG